MKRAVSGVWIMALAAVVTAAEPAEVSRLEPSTDEERLLALHRTAMEAHLESDVEKLMRAEVADTIVVSRGEISRPTLDDRRAMFGPYFAATEFETYRDMVPPVVRVSDDATLGWVIAQVEASGRQRAPSGESETVSFQSAWIELYEKRDGEWRRTGNVSNFAPREPAAEEAP